MGQNDENMQSCKSVRCCCKLISKCQETPSSVVITKPRNNGYKRAKHTQISLCDFLNSHPIPEWIKVNDVRPQQLQNQQRPIQSSTPDYPKSSSALEDVQSSQIIINFGTVVTNGACKRDSCQQTDPEVQQQVCPTTISPPVDRSTSACPPAKRSPNYPQTDRSTSKCLPADQSTSKYLPADRSTTTCPPTDCPVSFCPVPTKEHSATRDNCNQEKASSAASSSLLKAHPESIVHIKCCCNCHS